MVCLHCATLLVAGGGLLAPLTTALETLLSFLQDNLDKLHVPYSYGYSIILLTFVVKALTYPLTKQQASVRRGPPPS